MNISSHRYRNVRVVQVLMAREPPSLVVSRFELANNIVRSTVLGAKILAASTRRKDRHVAKNHRLAHNRKVVKLLSRVCERIH